MILSEICSKYLSNLTFENYKPEDFQRQGGSSQEGSEVASEASENEEQVP